jgi:acyl-CoA thioester hydrolase
LTNRTEIPVKFSEVDQLRMVWHGNYIRYFEDGRESFGKQYGLSYLNMYDRGFLVPVVHIHCDYKAPLKYGDIAVLETKFIPTDAAKILFEYTLYNKATGALVATGESVQVFIDTAGELQLANPPFFVAWKEKHGLA